jgi:outer membrane protein TolC
VLALLLTAALTLDGAVTMALERNPDLQKQVLLTLSAEQDKVLARSVVLPRVDFNGSWTDTRNGGGTVVIQNVPISQPAHVFQAWQGALTASWLIFDGGKWWNNLDAASLGYDASQQTLDEQKLQITYLVEQRFYELVRAQRQLVVLTEAGARSRDQAEFTQRLFEGGRATQADVYAARANRDNDEVNRLGQERLVELARVDLATAVGLDPGEPLTVAEPPGLMNDPAVAPPVKDAIARAYDVRPSLKAASKTVESNRAAASATSGGYWPSVSLGAGYTRSSEKLGDIFSDPTINSTLYGGVNLTWNIFGGLATKANVRKAEIQQAIAENDYQAARRSVAADVEKAVAQLATARTQVKVAQQAQETAKEGLRLAKTRQEVGVGTQLEVRDAELKLTQAQLAVVGSLVDGREAEAALRRAQGGT